MGMYFNTEGTTKMVALVNRHFASHRSGGGIRYWQNHKGDVDPGAGNPLVALANAHNVVPDTNYLQKRWRDWLTALADPAKAASAIAVDTGAPASMTAAGSGYLPPQAAVYNTVDKELRRQLFNALNDSKCIEITLAAVPSDSVTIIGAQFMAVGATEYVCHITVKTRTVDNL